MRSSGLRKLKLFEMRIKTWNSRTTIYGVRSIAFLTSLSAHCALHHGAIVNWELERQISGQDIYCTIPFSSIYKRSNPWFIRVLLNSLWYSIFNQLKCKFQNVNHNTILYRLWASAVLRQIWIWSHKNRATVNKEFEDDNGPWYRVINSNCVLWFLSDRLKKTKKWQNPTIFVELTYRHFDILMSRCGQMRKNGPFQGCAKIALRLHTARTEKPDTP